MGLFDKLAGNKQVSLSPQAGLLLCAITMVAADGDVDDDEMAIIQRLDRSRTSEAWDSAVKVWKQNSIKDCITFSTQAMNQEQRLTAMANLIDIAMADGALHGKEKDLLETYIQAFDLDVSAIENIVSVISIKNNQVIFGG